MSLIHFLPDRLRGTRVMHLVRPYTLVGPDRILSLYDLARSVEQERMVGDVVECGVRNGGTAAILAHFATRSRLGRKVWLFDSFQGMPPTTPVYGDQASDYTGKDVGDVEPVRRVL